MITGTQEEIVRLTRVLEHAGLTGEEIESFRAQIDGPLFVTARYLLWRLENP